MGRILVDASSLIAMARLGELDVLVELGGRFHVTEAVLSEVTEPEEPGAGRIEDLVASGSIEVIEQPTIPEDLIELGLGEGEASSIASCDEGDRLLIDDRNARQVARARGHEHVGLIGLLVSAVATGHLPPGRGLGILRALSRSEFRMTVELYDWAREQMEDAGSL